MTEIVLVAIITSGGTVLSATVTAIGAVWVKRKVKTEVWSARDQSHGEHGKTAEKVAEIHKQLNGGLDARIDDRIARALEERG